METIRRRFDLIASIRSAEAEEFLKAEHCAFHVRKIVEGIAFGCLVAVENGMGHVPRDANGQWKADIILSSLKSKNIAVFPSPSRIRIPAQSEIVEHGALAAIVEGIPERRITHDDLIAIYRANHKWLHEINPYLDEGRTSFLQAHDARLWSDLERLEWLMREHTISIRGQMFFCVMQDKIDGLTKVVPLSKVASLWPLPS